MKLILVRHGESNWNKYGVIQGNRDPYLSEEGRRQTQLLMKRLSKEKIDVIYSSPLRRALEGAKMIAEARNLNVCIRKELEEFNLGEWQGKTIRKVEKEYPGMLNKWFTNPSKVEVPGGETLAAFRKRIVKVFDEIKRDYSNGTVLVVTHGGVISMYLVHVLEMNPDRIWRIPLKNTSLSVLYFDGDERVSLTLFNDTCHLGEDLTPLRAW
jgi:probable phosphoglycerate mutase